MRWIVFGVHLCENARFKQAKWEGVEQVVHIDLVEFDLTWGFLPSGGR